MQIKRPSPIITDKNILSRMPERKITRTILDIPIKGLDYSVTDPLLKTYFSTKQTIREVMSAPVTPQGMLVTWLNPELYKTKPTEEKKECIEKKFPYRITKEKAASACINIAKNYTATYSDNTFPKAACDDFVIH